MSTIPGSKGYNYNAVGGKRKMPIAANAFYRITLCRRWLESGVNGAPSCQYISDCHFAHGEEELRTLPGAESVIDDSVYDPTR